MRGRKLIVTFYCDMRDQTQGLINARQALSQSHNPQSMVEALYSDYYHGYRTLHLRGNSKYTPETLL